MKKSTFAMQLDTPWIKFMFDPQHSYRFSASVSAVSQSNLSVTHSTDTNSLPLNTINHAGLIRPMPMYPKGEYLGSKEAA